MNLRAARLVAACLLLAACTPNSDAPTTASTTPAPSTTATTLAPVPPAGPTAPPVRRTGLPNSIYFVMTDRFANGDPRNDTGGVEGGPLDHGYLPTDTGYFHGGDVAGLSARLPYLAELGVTGIWLTPPFVNRTVQGLGEVDDSSAGYHGYWQIDWSRIDPHLGTDADMLAFIDAAAALGIDVYFDFVVNHTGDVITYEEGTFAYRSRTVAPYLDAEGVPFDDRDFVGTGTFPELDPTVSFPYTPTFATPEDSTIKWPDWLDDPIHYHNRGDSTFVDENSLYGDFYGLDDLFTEHPAVVAGMIDLAADVVRRFPVAGFRLDTVKHVNDEFWQEWVPAVNEAAVAAGRDDFFMFGEVFSNDAIFNSWYTTALGMPSVLDFVLDEALSAYVGRDQPADVMVQAFDRDDWYTDADSNASVLVTFFGNHDRGRMGHVIASGSPGARPEVLVEKMLLGFDLLFLSRGVPVVYYGDEQGFVGIGGDRSARQTMFPSVADEYAGQPTIGSSATPGDDNFDPTHPLFLRVRDLNRLRQEHPALATGAQIVGEPNGSVLSFSRIDRTERIEYLIVANNGPLPIPATVSALSSDTTFETIHGGDGVVTSTGDGAVTVDVPARSTVVLRATSPLAVPEPPPAIRMVRPDPGTVVPTPRYRIEAEVGDRRYAEVTFSVAVDGGDPVVLGTDDAPPYRVFWNNGALPAGASVEITAVVTDGSDRFASDTVTVTLGPRD